MSERIVVAFTKAEAGVVFAALTNWREDDHETGRLAAASAQNKLRVGAVPSRADANAIIRKALALIKAASP